MDNTDQKIKESLERSRQKLNEIHEANVDRLGSQWVNVREEMLSYFASELSQIARESEKRTLDQFKGNVIGLFPTNRIGTGDKYTSEEIITRVWDLIDHKLKQSKERKNDE
jgi:hypothetical protein